MNRFILTAQGSLLYPENYTKEQLRQNHLDAWAAYDVAANTAGADRAADYAARAAAWAARAANAAANYATGCTEYWLNKYFELTGENRQDYIDAINEGK